MSTIFPKIIKGSHPGKTTVILASVHGNEPCGRNAFEALLGDLVIENGTVIFEIGNPRAVEQNTRFAEINLNRMFRSDNTISEQEKNTYEYQRAQELKKLFDGADALLDIHSSFNKKSKRFIICEPNGFAIASQLPFDLRCTGFDEYEPGGTDGYMNSHNKIGICVECGQHEDPLAIEVAEDTIKSFLIAMGHTSGNTSIQNQKTITIFDLYKNKSNMFRLTREFEDFENLPAGTSIGFDGELEIKTPSECSILFAHNIVDKIGQECFLLAK